jgi:hypothetical protein
MTATEQQERLWYISCITEWAQCEALAAEQCEALAAELSQLATFDLVTLWSALKTERMLGNLEWGQEHAAQASTEEREMIIDAAVGIDTGGMFYGTEPVPILAAGTYLDQSGILWARARRRQLRKLSPAKLADECGRVLGCAAARKQRHDTVMTDAQSAERRRMSKVVSVRFEYKPALIETAGALRQQGLSVKDAERHLAFMPYLTSEGATVTSEGGFLLVKQADTVLGRITMGQFQREYWRKGKK